MRKLLRREEGTAAVEFAFLAPVLALIAGGIIQLGSIAQTAVIASNAAREGARYASVSDPQAATMAATYLSDALGSRTDVTPGAITVTPPVPTFGSAGVGNAITVSVPVTVTIGMPIMQNIFGASFQIDGSATMRVSQ